MALWSVHAASRCCGVTMVCRALRPGPPPLFFHTQEKHIACYCRITAFWVQEGLRFVATVAAAARLLSCFSSPSQPNPPRLSPVLWDHPRLLSIMTTASSHAHKCHYQEMVLPTHPEHSFGCTESHNPEILCLLLSVPETAPSPGGTYTWCSCHALRSFGKRRRRRRAMGVQGGQYISAPSALTITPIHPPRPSCRL